MTPTSIAGKLAASFALVVVVVAASACSSADDPTESEELTSQDEAALEPCSRRPPLARTCHVWRKDLVQSVTCPWNLGRGWAEWAQSGCLRVPGSVCDNGEPRRQRIDERNLPSCGY